ncbi:major paralogous domain-containing protein [Ekhidna lutea]|uniref:Major paralogous domain-containing protein n=1 Tax=Ekhidna lutea TaxID=447679 RepID=A0A239HG91_EKHLU|nr:FISUMP domain-containing protein [Ekhidna lutea]SNS80446.1 major paralogous domain-containing protein [Ekhidna lutea]
MMGALKFTSVVAFFCLQVSFHAFSQSESTITDERDGQVYRIKSINGTTWMLDNLNYHSQLSLAADSSKNHAPPGRFYHLNELDSVCPPKWIVSRKEDWLTYFEYIVDNLGDSTIKITENKMDEIVEIDYWGKIDIFNLINPLEINHTAWVEGGQWFDSKMMEPPSAHFWVLEPQRDEPERTHVHFDGDIRIRIHRHKHHLKPNQEKKLRRFMVRCVKCE